MERDPLLTRFNVGQRRTAHAALGGHPLLRQVALSAQPAQRLTELTVLGLDVWHRTIIRLGGRNVNEADSQSTGSRRA